MNIPPQLFNMLQRGQSIETCPNCHRIVYWDRIMDAGAAGGAEAKPA
jgi:predicted  nucleic acid-binding Zn-ribbon protein